VSTGVKVAIGLVLVCVLACAGLVVGGKVWFEANKDELMAMGERAMTEGEAFGMGTEQPGCVNEALGRVGGCAQIDPMCEAEIGIFLESCLGAATTSPGFCDGVPQESSIMDSATWRLATCQNLGRAGDEACGRILGSVQKHCHPS
jgi:hypothetical protein